NGLKEPPRDASLDAGQVSQGPDRLEYRRELQDSLAMVSYETGGIAFLNSSNFMKGLSEITSDMGQQYWLCASLPENSKRGQYHSIEVKVDRNDVKVRHRRGYVD